MQHSFQKLIGPHGVSDVGLEIAYAPDTPWYLNLLGFVGDGGVDLFDTASTDFQATGRIENLWDLNDATTFELGGSVMTGPAAVGDRRNFYGGDVRVKWRDQRRSHGNAFEWMTELLVDNPDDGEHQMAIASCGRYRFSRRWWVGGGYSMHRVKGRGEDAAHEYKGQLALVPSEFSMLRLDTSYVESPTEGDVFKVQLQVNFTIGSHPAHLY
jgi:hypothetical protein